MATIALKIPLPDRYHEFLIAELSDLDFESFEQQDDLLIAYIPDARWNDVARESLDSWLAAHGLPSHLTEEVIADQNWNRLWEETVQPIAVEPFLIKPTWHDVPARYAHLILLEIDPKMSFGTGYHESTRLMLRMLPAYVRPGSSVLDAGTGTGILAIAATKLGAAHVIAFDMDPWSQENAVENFYLNSVADRTEMRNGSIERVDERDFDLILANINLHVITGLLSICSEKLTADGSFLVSGILLRDRDPFLKAAEQSRFVLREEHHEKEWWAGALAPI